MPQQNQRFYEFDGYRIEAGERLLRRGDTVIHLQPRAADLLLVLLESHGSVVSKDELLKRVWSDSIVEEGNLSNTVFQLRKALGGENSEMIKTVPKRGYRFVGDVKSVFANDAKSFIAEETVTRILVKEEIEIEDEPRKIVEAETLPAALLTNPEKKWNWKATLLLSFGLILIGGAAIFAWFRFNSEQKPIATRNSQLANPMSVSRITNSGKVGASSISPDGKFVIYSQNYTDGFGALYIRQTDTNIETRLVTHDKGEFGTKTFSPDGAFVFYIALDAPHPVFALYRVPVLGGSPVRLVEKVQNNFFALSPDGSHIAVVRNDDETKQSSLVSIRTDGSGAEQILTTLPFQEMRLLPGGAYSPDGRKFVLPARTAAATKNYSQDALNVMAFDLATGEIKNFTEEIWEDTGLMQWMADGSGVVLIGKRARQRNQIYFISYPTGEVSRITTDANGYGNYGLGITKDGSTLVADVWEFPGRIWTMDAKGDVKTAAQLPAGDTTGPSYGLSVFPDGRIIFPSRTNSDVDLWTMNEGDAEAKPLTSDAFFDTHPAAAPDGGFIVFASDRAGEGTSHLFRMNADGSQIRQLTFGEGFEYSPDISPDGNWIIYQAVGFDAAKADWTDTIRKIPSAGGASVESYAGCVVPAFSPDGEKFSCVAQVGNDRATLIVGSAGDGEPLKTFEVNCHQHYYLPARWTPDGAALIYRDHENQVSNLWKQNLSGGSPVRFTDFKSETIFSFVFTRDGKRLLLARGNTTVNVVMFKNFR